MKPKREGPFLITEVLGPITYRLQLPASWRIHNVFHAEMTTLDQLRKYVICDLTTNTHTQPNQH